MGLLKCLELLELPRWAAFGGGPSSPSQQAIAYILSPLRQHERVNLQRGRHTLYLNSWLPAETNSGQLELVSVAVNSAGP